MSCEFSQPPLSLFQGSIFLQTEAEKGRRTNQCPPRAGLLKKLDPESGNADFFDSGDG